MTPRAALLSALVGGRWEPNARGPGAWDCWHLVRHVERVLFGRELPDVDLPELASWSWMIEAIRDHPERDRWVEVDPGLVIRAVDGALVLMARCDRPAHVGVWLAPELAVLHADARSGVVLQTPLTLHTAGWTRLRFYEPRTA